MKNIHILIFIAFLFIASISFAQFGIQAGPGFASTNQKLTIEGLISDDLDWESRAGIYAGFFYRKQIGKIALQPELNFMQKGGKYEIEGDKMTLFINYLELPIYALYNGGETNGFYGGIGPSFNYGLVGNFKMGDEEEGISFGSEHDVSRFHLGINGQLGYQFANGLGINAYLSKSITKSPTEQTEELQEVQVIKIKTEYSYFNWGIRVSYLFGKSAKK
ncbi:MAG: PorT family protein [Chitinophagaceae bacterium]|nr:PorT family protein [Chitinophagaceae bacterium]